MSGERLCERCGEPPRPEPDEDGRLVSTMLDYCAVCSRDLCPDCMAEGCCGHVPAASGQAEDFGES